jgi:hypothetical protein
MTDYFGMPRTADFQNIYSLSLLSLSQLSNSSSSSSSKEEEEASGAFSSGI